MLSADDQRRDLQVCVPATFPVRVRCSPTMREREAGRCDDAKSRLRTRP
jgi:hypothetical protein